MNYPVVKAKSLRVGDKVAVYSAGSLWTDLEVLGVSSISVSLHVNDDELPMAFRIDSTFFLMEKTKALPKKLGAIIERLDNGWRYMLVFPNGYDHDMNTIWVIMSGDYVGSYSYSSEISDYPWVEIFGGCSL